MSNKVAVIDLGTNTFHLLIAEQVKNQVNHLIRDTVPVKLGEGGINDGIIHPQPFERGIACMSRFAETIASYDVAQIRAIATSAIRNARNGAEFVAAVKERTGILIETIDGLQEAEFIFYGIKASGCLSAENSLIIDIGGGSVEFIICNASGVKWKHSFEIGAARMMGLFHKIDPLTAESATALENWLDENLKILFKAVKTQPVTQLIGSSGSFETFAEMLEAGKGNSLDIDSIKTYDFKLADFSDLADKLRLSNHDERLQMKGIIPLRIDMIVTASLLTSFVIEKLEIGELSMSTYSLKEGVVAEMLECN